MSILVEACCGTVDEVIKAGEVGARRIELCDNLDVGGLTPSIDLVRGVKKNSKLPIMAMLRPREGDFCYTDDEFKTMCEQATTLIAEGVEGLVFGILRKDNSVDTERCDMLIRHISHECFKIPKRVELVFHKAYDETPDWKFALDNLIKLGFDRVLTSGHGVTALEGAEELAQITEFAKGKIEILAGGGIRKDNVLDVVKKTGVNQAHLKCFGLGEVVEICNSITLE